MRISNALPLDANAESAIWSKQTQKMSNPGTVSALSIYIWGKRGENEVGLQHIFYSTGLLGRYALRVKASGSFLTLALAALWAPCLYAQDHILSATDTAPIAPTTTELRAAEELRAEEQQRILGVVPAFNISNVSDAAPLNTGQKFQLALKSAVDPFAFVAAGLDAGLGQLEHASPGFGYGAQGFGMRMQAAYLDAFDGAMLGNALFPALLHQDPRYFRQGTGTFRSRLWHAAVSTVRCKDDNGRDDWNYSNLLGNVAAGAISNTYYTPADRGANLVFGRALTVTAEGAVGAVFYEFWPDISRKFLTRKKKQQS